MGWITFVFDYNIYARSNIVMSLRLMTFIIVSFVIVFSIRQIPSKFDIYFDNLSVQRQNLMDDAIRMRREIEYRKISEKAAKESEYKFRNIFERSSDPMAIVGQNGKFIDYNLAFLKLTEISTDQIRKKSLLDIAPESYKEFFSSYSNNFKNLPPRFELNYANMDSGKLVYLDVTTTQIDYEGEVAVMAIIREKTEKKNQESNIY